MFLRADTHKQFEILESTFYESWKPYGGVKIVYEGADINKAKEAIKGYPRIEETVNLDQ